MRNNSSNSDSPIMSEVEFANGELSHSQFEKSRKLAMLTGLTKSKRELESAIELDLDTYIETIRLTLESIDHFNDVQQLLLLSLARIYAVLDEEGLAGNLPSDLAKKLSYILTDSEMNSNS